MIRYTLECADGHSFEDWFDSMADYDRKAVSRDLSCPDCGSHDVHKALCAPNVARTAAPAPACAGTGGPGCGRCAFDA